MPESDPQKRCSKCGDLKPLGEFPKRKTSPDGRRGQCQVCWKVYQDAWDVKNRGATRWPNVAEFDMSDVEVDLSDLSAEAELVDELPPMLVSFGTPMQRASAEALIKHGNIVDAAAELQLEPHQLRAHLDELQRRAATRGYAPGNGMTQTVPQGFAVKGVSSYYKIDKATGEPRMTGQWVKSNRDQDEKYQQLLDAMSTIADRWEGMAEPVPAPTVSDDDLLACYVAGDPHLGMMAWAAETGNNFDLKIAERELYAAVDHLVAVAPAAKHGLVTSVGDFFHADNRGNTTTGGTPVDSDARWPKVLSVGIRLMRRMIDRALEKHEHVTVVCSCGNHDWHTSIMLSIALAQFYEYEPRVTVDTSPAKFHWLRHGKVLIGITHGDTVKLADLGEVMAVDRPTDWGETEFRYWFTGHIHHDTVKELRGCIVESFRTLAPADAWHKGKGYRSGNDMKVLIFHKQWGQINRHIVGINQIRNK